MDSAGIRRVAAAAEVTELRPGKIQAVLFDLGDTLINFGPVRKFDLLEKASRMSYAYLQELGQTVGGFRWYHFWNSNAIRLRLLASTVTGNDFDSMMALQFYGRRRGLKLSPAEWEELNWRWYSPLVDQAWVEEDLCESLQTLREMDLRLGIVSNTFVNGSSLDRHMERVGILEFFEMRMYSYELTCRKPARRIFDEAAQRIGVEPGRILFVGDRLDKDVYGSRRAGMNPVLKRAYTNQGKTAPAGVPVIDRIAELPDVVRSFNGEAQPA